MQSLSQEKKGLESDHIEVDVDKQSTGRTPEDNSIDVLTDDIRPAAERQLVRMLDCRLLPTIILIYIMNYIDRVAVASARLKGLTEDLQLTDVQYDTVLAILYASYITFMVPSNMLLNRISRPSYYIPACVMVWGITSALTGVSRSYSGLLAARIFVGCPEAAFYPGAFYLLSRWYTRKELAFRGALLYGGNLVSNAFGGLMAAGILSRMEDKLGIRAWRWLFYIEGAITIAIGLGAIFLLPDYPHNTRWLSPAQRHLAQTRLAEDTGEADADSASESAFDGLKMAVKDVKVYLFGLMGCAALIGTGFSYFFPTIAGTLGYSTTITLLLTAPPWVLATIFCSLLALHADRTRERFFHCCAPFSLVIVGYIIGVSTFSVAGRYVSMFFMTSGAASYPLIFVWLSNTVVRPPAKRSAAIAIANGIANCGALASSYVWKAQWAPGYHPSMYVGIGALVISTAIAFTIRCILVRENQRMEREERERFDGPQRERIQEAAYLEGISYEEAVRRRMGFRFLS